MRTLKKQFILWSVFFVITIFLTKVSSATGPTIDKSSILIWSRKINAYYPNGKYDESQYSWLPLINFKVNGPIASGTNFVVEFTLPDGKPWVKLDLTSEEQCATCYYLYDRAGVDLPDEKATTATGNIGLTITASNELEGKKDVLFKGGFVIKKYNWNTIPEFKNKFDYYVDQDWRLPISFIYGDWGQNSYGNWVANTAPSLLARFWFRGEDPDAANPQAFLFYKGNKIATSETANSCGSASTWETSINNWYCVVFWFSGMKPVKWYLGQYDVDAYPDAFVLSKNPGDYEIKVLRGGKLSRDVKFTIGSDGKIVDNGYSTQINNLSIWVFPSQMLGDGDGVWSKELWKTGAFYGNPLTGFVAP